MKTKKYLIVEVFLTTFILVLICRILHSLSYLPFLSEYYTTIFAILFLYVPIVILLKGKRPIDFVERESVDYLKAFLLFLVAAVIVFPPFLFGAHIWQKVVNHKEVWHFAAIPNFWKILATQLLMVALPEEFFFRGYMQSTFDRVWSPRWNVLGTKLGWGWISTAIVFTIAHSIVFYQWWQFAIFFPALLFGYLRVRSRGIFAPILFHAASNMVMEWIVRCYM